MSFVLDVLAWLLFGVRTQPATPIPAVAAATPDPPTEEPATGPRPRCVCTHPPTEHDNETGWCRYGDCSIYEPIDDHWANYRPEPKPETEAA